MNIFAATVSTLPNQRELTLGMPGAPRVNALCRIAANGGLEDAVISK
jgi:hypothetical protein